MKSRLTFLTITAIALSFAAVAHAAAPVAPVAFADDASCTAQDRELIARTYELARASSLKGDGGHGALLLKDGKVLVEFSSATNSTRDATKHAETGLIQLVSRKYGVAIFEGAVLYTSEEPCIMCCGAVRSAGLRTFVYGTTGAQAKRISGRPLPDRLLECREVYARLEYPIAIRGPLLEKEGLALLVEHHERRTAVK